MRGIECLALVIKRARSFDGNADGGLVLTQRLDRRTLQLVLQVVSKVAQLAERVNHVQLSHLGIAQLRQGWRREAQARSSQDDSGAS